MPTRAEHIAWVKQHALLELENESLDEFTAARNAVSSVAVDLGSEEVTRGHDAITMGTYRMLAGEIATRADARRFIEELQ